MYEINTLYIFLNNFGVHFTQSIKKYVKYVYISTSHVGRIVYIYLHTYLIILFLVYILITFCTHHKN